MVSVAWVYQIPLTLYRNLLSYITIRIAIDVKLNYVKMYSAFKLTTLMLLGSAYFLLYCSKRTIMNTCNLSKCPNVYNTVPSETHCEACCSVVIRTKIPKTSIVILINVHKVNCYGGSNIHTPS